MMTLSTTQQKTPSFLVEIPSSSAFLNQMRSQAREKLSQPQAWNPKSNDWRYTSLKPLLQESYEMLSPPSTDEIEVLKAHLQKAPLLADSHRVVFVDGHYCEALCRPILEESQVECLSLAYQLETQPDLIETFLSRINQGDKLTSTLLNEALFLDGCWIKVKKENALKVPIEILHLSLNQKPSAVHNLHFIQVEPHSSVKILNHSMALGDANFLLNTSTRLIAESGSRVEYYEYARENPHQRTFSHFDAIAEKHAHLGHLILSEGAKNHRSELKVTLAGPLAHAQMVGIGLLGENTHLDHQTSVVHQSPHCTSFQDYRHVLLAKSQGAFSGLVKVCKNAIKTDAHQSNRTLMLDKTGEMNARPQLEILNDDVKCAHGATMGELDSKALFYLQSRGIARDEAKRILTHAFIKQLIEPLEPSPLSQFLDSAIEKWTDLHARTSH